MQIQRELQPERGLLGAAVEAELTPALGDLVEFVGTTRLAEDITSAKLSK
ncbi:hypothetical protein MCHIJ_00060 [Mycolicibacterium chitae]|nr:hypothetical protein MCHIJ_00060 [Mycolicibacterium chitae]